MSRRRSERKKRLLVGEVEPEGVWGVVFGILASPSRGHRRLGGYGCHMMLRLSPIFIEDQATKNVHDHSHRGGAEQVAI